MMQPDPPFDQDQRVSMPRGDALVGGETHDQTDQESRSTVTEPHVA
jgi:hypothetical protein